MVGAAFYACIDYGKKNGRYFDKKEKLKVVTGFIFINFFIRLPLSIFILNGTSSAVLETAILVILGELLILHSIILYFSVSASRKMLIKQGIISV
jgi:hypothetical protein